jgi:hypothetical protein
MERGPDIAFASLAGAVVYFLLPSEASKNVAFIASNLIGSGAILLGLRLHRPASRWAWRLLAAYCLCTAAGNTIWIIYDGVLHVDPFPSPGDAFFLGGYVVEATGLLLLIRRRNPGRDLARSSTPRSSRRASASSPGYSLWHRWLTIPHWRSTARPRRLDTGRRPARPAGRNAPVRRGAARVPAFRLLGATLLIQLLADTLFALLNLNGTYHTGHAIDLLILTYYVRPGGRRLASHHARPRTADAAAQRPRLRKPPGGAHARISARGPRCCWDRSSATTSPTWWSPPYQAKTSGKDHYCLLDASEPSRLAGAPH